MESILKLEHHISFWNKESFEKAVKLAKSKKYSKKQFDGSIMIPNKILVKIHEDFQTYAMCTKSGMIQQDRKVFNSREDFDKAIEDINLDEIDRIWGKIIISMS